MAFVFLSHGLIGLKAFALCITPCMTHASACQPPSLGHKESTGNVSAITHQACPCTGLYKLCSDQCVLVTDGCLLRHLLFFQYDRCLSSKGPMAIDLAPLKL